MKDLYKGLKWWEIVICLLPISLVILGGALGGAIGAAGMIANLKLWKRKSSTLVKILLVLGVTVLCYIVFSVIATLFYSTIH